VPLEPVFIGCFDGCWEPGAHVRPPAAAAQCIDAEVCRDAGKPGPKILVFSRSTLQQPGEGLLDDVICILGGSGDAISEPPEAPPLGAEERLQDIVARACFLADGDPHAKIKRASVRYSCFNHYSPVIVQNWQSTTTL
jgi:hypothetical protein